MHGCSLSSFSPCGGHGSPLGESNPYTSTIHSYSDCTAGPRTDSDAHFFDRFFFPPPPPPPPPLFLPPTRTIFAVPTPKVIAWLSLPHGGSTGNQISCSSPSPPNTKPRQRAVEGVFSWVMCAAFSVDSDSCASDNGTRQQGKGRHVLNDPSNAALTAFGTLKNFVNVFDDDMGACHVSAPVHGASAAGGC